MRRFLLLSVLATVAVARPSVVQVSSPLSGLSSASASASASASSLPQSLSVLRLVPSAPIGPDGRVLETLEVALARAEHEAAHRRAQAELARENARSVLGLSPVLSSASSSASASASASSSAAPLSADGRVVDTLEVSLARAAHAAAHRNEQLRLANQAVRASQAHALAQQHGANSLLSATRLAQSLVSVGPSGVVQLVESPEQAAVNNLRLLTQQARSNVPLLVDSDGQLVSSSLLVL